MNLDAEPTHRPCADPASSGEAADDAALLARFAGHGDRAALGTLFARHLDAAYRLSRRLLPNAADAEDAVQTAFLKVQEHAARFRPGEGTGVKAWMLGFVVNTCADRRRQDFRRQHREQQAAPHPEESAMSDPERKELWSRVVRELERLPEHYRSAVWLCYCEGLSSTEAAAALQVNGSTLRNRLARGLERLRAALAASGCALAAAELQALFELARGEVSPASLSSAVAEIASGARLPAPAAPAGRGKRLAARAGLIALALAACAGLAWWAAQSPAAQGESATASGKPHADSTADARPPAEQKANASAPARQGEIVLPEAVAADRIAFDGRRLWTMGHRSTVLHAFDPASGQAAGTLDVSGAVREPADLAFDPEGLWVMDQASRRLLCLDPATAQVRASHQMPHSVYGIAFHEGSLFVEFKASNRSVISATVIAKAVPGAELEQCFRMPQRVAGRVAPCDPVWTGGQLWCRGEFQGEPQRIVRLDPGTGRILGYLEPRHGKPVASIAPDEQGGLWVLDGERRIVRVEANTLAHATRSESK